MFITKIQKLADGIFKLNGAVEIGNIELINTGDSIDVQYSFNYDNTLVTEKEAIELCDVFINEAFKAYLEEN